MYHKIVREDGETIITEFKSFRYVEQVNDENNLRYGAVISSYIEAEIFGTQQNAIQEGETLTYYQVFDTDNEFNTLPDGQTNEIKIGVFTASVVLPGKFIYSLTAYDNISKLDIDFSAIMNANANSFPMTVSQLIGLISAQTGVTINIGQCELVNIGSNVSVFYFYSNGITCRQFISYIAEVSSCNVYCLPDGTIYAQPYVSNRSLTIPVPPFYWKDNYHYIICPTDTVEYTGTDSVGNPITLIPIFYKENGFEKANYTCDSLDSFSVRKTDGTSVWSLTGTNAENIYEINTNPIVDYLMLDDSIDWDDVMTPVETAIESETLKGIVPFKVHLFPFRNPFRAGEFLPYIQGADGVRFRSLIMKMEITNSEAVLYCYGNEKWHVSSQLNRTADEMNAALSAQINKYDIIRLGSDPNKGDNYFTIGSFRDFKDYNDHAVVYYGPLNMVFIQAGEYFWSFDSLGNTDLPKPLSIDNGGTGAANASDALTALGAVSKSGDTMTGGLTLRYGMPVIDLRSTLVEENVTPSSQQFPGAIRIMDKNGKGIAYFRAYQDTSGNQHAQFFVRRTVNGRDTYNELRLGLNSAGNSLVYLTDKSPWLYALGLTVSRETTISNIITAASSDITVLAAHYASYGKMAQIRLQFRKTTAVSSGLTSLGTIVSGKRPVYGIGGALVWASNKTAYIGENGVVQVSGPITANENMYITATYILP